MGEHRRRRATRLLEFAPIVLRFRASDSDDTMSLYAIGDIQGCHAELCQMLDLIAFSPANDRLWLVGDLVNRGPGSLAVMREVRKLGDAATIVIGNHDFHLLTVAAGHARMHREDTLAPVLDAPDRDELLAWLRSWPLVVVDGERLMVHAGLLPSWTPATALMLSREVQAIARRRPPRRVPRDALRRRAERVAQRPRRLRPPARDRQRVHAIALLHGGRPDGIPRKARAAVHAAGFQALVRARNARIVLRERRLRSLVDARADARAARDDARLGMPVGRSADGDQAG